jgi:putative signal transducing protein
MKTVASCYDIQEARSLQIALEAADIPSFIPDEATGQNAPYFFIGTNAGVRLQVAEEHVPEAQHIIGNARKAHSEHKSNQDAEEERF